MPEMIISGIVKTALFSSDFTNLVMF